MFVNEVLERKERIRKMDGVEIIDMWDWMDFARTNYFIFARKMYESVYVPGTYLCICMYDVPVCTDRADCTPVSTCTLYRTIVTTDKWTDVQNPR